MKKKEISIEVVRSKNYQTIKQSTTLTLEEGDNETTIRAEETKYLTASCKKTLHEWENEGKEPTSTKEKITLLPKKVK